MAKFGAEATGISAIDTRHIQSLRPTRDTGESTAEAIKAFGGIAKTLVQGKARADVREGIQSLTDSRVREAAGTEDDDLIELRTELLETEDTARKSEISADIKKMRRAKLQGLMSDTEFRAATETYAKQKIQSSLGADAQLVHEVLNEEFARSKNVLALINEQQQDVVKGNQMHDWMVKQALNLGMPDATVASDEALAFYISRTNADKIKFDEETRTYTRGERTLEQYLSSNGGTLHQKVLIDTRSQVDAILQGDDLATKKKELERLRTTIKNKHLMTIVDKRGNPLNVAGRDHHVIKTIEADLDKMIELANGVADGTTKQTELDNRIKYNQSSTKALLLTNPYIAVPSALRSLMGDTYVDLIGAGFATSQGAAWVTSVANTMRFGETAFKESELGIPETWQAMHKFLSTVAQHPELAPEDITAVKNTLVRLIRNDEEFEGKEFQQYMDGIVQTFANKETAGILSKFEPKDRAELDKTLQDYTVNTLNTLLSNNLEVKLKSQQGQVYAVGTDADANTFNERYAGRFNQLIRTVSHTQGHEDYEGGAEAIVRLSEAVNATRGEDFEVQSMIEGTQLQRSLGILKENIKENLQDIPDAWNAFWKSMREDRFRGANAAPTATPVPAPRPTPEVTRESLEARAKALGL